MIPLLLAIGSLASCDKDPGDDQPETARPQVVVDHANVIEGSGDQLLKFPVSLSEASSAEITLTFSLKGTAEPGKDYTDIGTSAVIPTGASSYAIEIPIIDDEENELSEDLELTITTATNAELQDGTATGTIEDNDEPDRFDVDGYLTENAHFGYEVTWQEEFTGDIDPATFIYDLGDGCPDICGWGNNELQRYTDDSENSFVEEGKLVIRAEQVAQRGYNSARMITKGKREFTFGRIDIRAKLPEGQGIWPAIWMLGSNIDEVGWPACGEIDIMEMVGHEPETVHGTAHWGPRDRGFSTFEGAPKKLAEKYSESFHVFTLLWEFNSITWYVDEEEFFSLTAKDVTDAAYPFNTPFFLLFNIAVGGNWPGDPDETTQFPQQMEIDYIRVFQRTN